MLNSLNSLREEGVNSGDRHLTIGVNGRRTNRISIFLRPKRSLPKYRNGNGEDSRLYSFCILCKPEHGIYFIQPNLDSVSHRKIFLDSVPRNNMSDSGSRSQIDLPDFTKMDIHELDKACKKMQGFYIKTALDAHCCAQLYTATCQELLKEIETTSKSLHTEVILLQLANLAVYCTNAVEIGDYVAVTYEITNVFIQPIKDKKTDGLCLLCTKNVYLSDRQRAPQHEIRNCRQSYDQGLAELLVLLHSHIDTIRKQRLLVAKLHASQIAK